MGFSVGGIVGGVLGAGIGAMTGNPAAGAEIGGSIGSMFGPSDERLAQRQYNQQYRDAVNLWNMQNEYNSPVQQMARLKAAGLNPMLVYGSGSVDGNSSTAPSAPAYRMVSRDRSGSKVSSAVEKFFLNKSMENAEDQSRTNVLNEEYLALRNDYMKARIENEYKKGAKGTVRERGIKDMIDELRYRKLLKELGEDGSDDNPPIKNGGTIGSAVNAAYQIGKVPYDAVHDTVMYFLNKSGWRNDFGRSPDYSKGELY